MKSQLEKELALVRGLVEEFLEDDPFPETVRPPALREAVRLYPLRGGKRLRPALTLWSCGAVGGDPVRALNAAAAVEIYHNWTLVHDDIIDCDELRRGKPTCHVELRARGTARFGLDAERSAKFGTDFAGHTKRVCASPYPGGSLFSAPAERGTRIALAIRPFRAAGFSAPILRGMRTA